MCPSTKEKELIEMFVWGFFKFYFFALSKQKLFFLYCMHSTYEMDF